MDCTEYLTEKALFMENLMGYCELDWVEIGEDEDQSDQIVGSTECKFKRLEVFKDLEEDEPIKDYNCIEAEFEVGVWFL